MYFSLQKYLTQESVPFINQFIHCCDEHDICYGTCLNDKDECDLKFKKCLYKRCSENIKSVYGQENTLHEKLRLKGSCCMDLKKHFQNASNFQQVALRLYDDPSYVNL